MPSSFPSGSRGQQNTYRFPVGSGRHVSTTMTLSLVRGLLLGCACLGDAYVLFFPFALHDLQKVGKLVGIECGAPTGEGVFLERGHGLHSNWSGKSFLAVADARRRTASWQCGVKGVGRDSEHEGLSAGLCCNRSTDLFLPFSTFSLPSA